MRQGWVFQQEKRSPQASFRGDIDFELDQGKGEVDTVCGKIKLWLTWIRLSILGNIGKELEIILVRETTKSLPLYLPD